MAIASAASPKTDNNRQAFKAKVTIRRNVLAAPGPRRRAGRPGPHRRRLFHKQNGIPLAVTSLAGICTGLDGAGGKQDAIIDRVIAGLARRMHCEAVERWRAEGRTDAGMRYIGPVLRAIETGAKMLRALILICSAVSAPQVSDCTRERALDVLVTKIETASPITCFMQAQAYLAESAIGASLTPGDRVRIVCRPIPSGS